MEPTPTPDGPRQPAVTDPDDALTAFDLDAMAALAEFETEHRRTLAMQSLYYRRRKAGGAV